MSKAHDMLRVWGSDVDEGTRAQARRATRLPFVPGHVALMPDAHIGIGRCHRSVVRGG
jgi:tRNA-splicing ligase RtcB